MGVDARAVVRGLRRAGPRLGAAPRAARREARGAAGADVVRQGRGPDRLEPDAGVLPVGAGQRPLDQPARPRARGHRRAGRGVRAGRGGAARATARLPRPAQRASRWSTPCTGARTSIMGRTPARGPTCWSRPPRTVCMVEGLGQRSLMPAGRGPEERTGNHARDGILMLHGPDVRPRRDASAGRDRGRRADGALPPRPAGRRRHGRPRPHRGAAARSVWRRSRSPWRTTPYELPESAFRYSADDEKRIQDMLEGLGYV